MYTLSWRYCTKVSMESDARLWPPQRTEDRRVISPFYCLYTVVRVCVFTLYELSGERNIMQKEMRSLLQARACFPLLRARILLLFRDLVQSGHIVTSHIPKMVCDGGTRRWKVTAINHDDENTQLQTPRPSWHGSFIDARKVKAPGWSLRLSSPY